jgi:hypothetical protein
MRNEVGSGVRRDSMKSAHSPSGQIFCALQQRYKLRI